MHITTLPASTPPTIYSPPDPWATLTAAEPGLLTLADSLSAPIDEADYGTTLMALEQYVDLFVATGTLTLRQADEAYRMLRAGWRCDHDR